jgi:maltose O-acetyltransferase
MKKFHRVLCLLVYYILGRHFPTQPVPGWRLGYFFRGLLVKGIFRKCGDGVIVKRNCYFGRGSTLEVGSRSQLGEQARIGPEVSIGSDVIMGPEVVIMTTSHEFEDPDRPIRLQPEPPIKKVIIEDDVWIGTRVTILPGVHIGRGAVIGACSVVTKDIPQFGVAVGNPAKVLRNRGSRMATLPEEVEVNPH